MLRRSKIGAGFGIVAGTAALFFLDGVPRVKKVSDHVSVAPPP